jgi:TruD family tRNA pseudouridine synthase
MLPKKDYLLRQQDEKKLKELIDQDPDLGLSDRRAQYTPEFFKIIGIDYEAKTLGKGFIRLNWSDFIVEEIAEDHELITIDPTDYPHPETFNIDKPKTEADLVKQGMATFEALERLSDTLNIPLADITYAGLKDGSAITAQKISFNGLSPEKLGGLQIPDLFLKNIHERKGVVEMGRLDGNRFTILVRSNRVDLEQLKDKINQIKENGFWNFYSLQRFGSRLATHLMGRLILQGKYQEAVKYLLIGDSPHEMNAFRHIRSEAAQCWGNWEKMSQIFLQFPYFFYYELTVLESLKETSINFIRALQSVKDQTRFYVYAYFSFLFNKLLSKMVAEGTAPDALPLLRDFPDVMDVYRDLVSAEEINSLSFSHRGLEFLNLGKRQTVLTKIDPAIHHVFETKVGYIFNFDLGKGAYATTILAEFFDLYQGKPIPEWVNQ